VKTDANPQDIMMGDNTIGNNGATTASSPANYRFGASASANTIGTGSAGALAFGITYAAYAANPYWAWDANDYHQKSGNILLADGSAQNASIGALHVYMASSTNSANPEILNFMP
jgi:prepilin-type processing-associated H-X9-DG protein